MRESWPFIVVVTLMVTFLTVAGIHHFNKWQDCRDAGGAYVQVTEFGDGYACLDVKQR